jgi:hypothetical protein
MFDKLMELLRPSEKFSDLEEYILSKNPQTCEDVEYWTRMYDLRPRFVTHALMPVAGMLK